MGWFKNGTAKVYRGPERNKIKLEVEEAVSRRLAALDPGPSVSMDVFPVFLSFFFLLILSRIAYAFCRRSRDESKTKRTRRREAAISGSPDPTPWRIQIHRT